ncbi:hypothetical protein MC7420_3337 [Coleofasciculus chthonoplastes PCC 7420]|uniref:Uncharacterized protein n=1 Tax=Coleofasciculus chthonoplastes PCC 7420 TaxID=118168 RepID=B4VZ42_9CYAN|nr:hypothetical protein MC7420_3337 [Coleofasciculus chthonoplastes PCC 7420]
MIERNLVSGEFRPEVCAIPMLLFWFQSLIGIQGNLDRSNPSFALVCLCFNP